MNKTAAMLGLTLCTATVFSDNWPRFRGPGGRATSAETGLPTEWSETQNLNWKLQLPGSGSSSPIIYGNHLFVTCYSDEDSGNIDNLKRHLLCIHPDTGKILWQKEVPSTATEDPWRGRIQEHGYASSTPVCDGEHVFVFFGKTGAMAFDMEGKEIWCQNLGTSSANRKWGSAASPILHRDLLIVNASEEGRAIYALDKKTGKEVWKMESDKLELTYSTPAVIGNELIVAVPQEIWGIDLDTGLCNWWIFTELQGNVSPSPLAIGDTAYILGGYPRVNTVAIRAGGKDDATTSNTLWSSRDSSYIPSAVEHEGYLYWIDNKGYAHCLKAATGELVYKEKLKDAGSGNVFYASMVLADGKLYAPSRTHGTFVLAAEPKFKLIAQNRIDSDSSDFNGSAAVSEGKIFLRSNEALYCIGEK